MQCAQACARVQGGAWARVCERVCARSASARARASAGRMGIVCVRWVCVCGNAHTRTHAPTHKHAPCATKPARIGAGAHTPNCTHRHPRAHAPTSARAASVGACVTAWRACACVCARARAHDETRDRERECVRVHAHGRVIAHHPRVYTHPHTPPDAQPHTRPQTRTHPHPPKQTHRVHPRAQPCNHQTPNARRKRNASNSSAQPAQTRPK